MIKRLARVLFGDYRLYRIYAYDTARATADAALPGVRYGPVTDTAQLENAEDPVLRGLVRYAGDGAFGYGAWVDGTLAALSWYWTPARHQDHDLWPLAPHDAWWAQLTTAAAYRGRGIAGGLARYATGQMAQRGYATLYGSVWHNHYVSMRACFEPAGWEYVAKVTLLYPLGRRRPWRFEQQQPALRKYRDQPARAPAV